MQFTELFDTEGLSGDLCLLWSKMLEIEVVDACKNYVYTFCRSKDDGLDWDCTFGYGNPKFKERMFLWERLSILHIRNNQ